jgi:hypothetical protein
MTQHIPTGLTRTTSRRAPPLPAADAAALGRPAQEHTVHETWEQVRSYDIDKVDGQLGWRRTSFRREVPDHATRGEAA